MRNKTRGWLPGTLMLGAFVVWTILIRTVDVQSAGPQGSTVGLARWNLWFHRLTGVHMGLYTVTDWLGLVPILVCLCFGVLGLGQWIRRRRLLAVDMDILLLGVYYVLVIFGYLFFEMVSINYRPVLIQGVLEASYPSSTTLLVLSVMPTLSFQLRRRGSGPVPAVGALLSAGFSAFMVLGRLISGVHWFTDILGAIFLSGGLFLLYRYAVTLGDGAAHQREESPWSSTRNCRS